ncbi:hypothetical protein Aperf_G00000071841 [Anoplocephala perfoliata]
MLKTKNILKPFNDVYNFEKGPNHRPASALDSVVVQRNTWSFAVEAVLEYCRINFDLFGQSKPISLISVDAEEKILTLWYESDQSLESIWKAFSSISSSTATVDLDYPGMPGLFSCKNTLHMPTPFQVSQSDPENIGRVIVIGSDIEPKLKDWLVNLVEAIQMLPTEPTYLPIHGSDWLFIDIDISPISQEVATEEVEIHSFGKHKFSYIHVPILSSSSLSRVLMGLAERNLDLVSTMVQDIPMKEEANSGSVSTMYGVELLHEAEGHAFLRRRGLANRLYLHLENDDTKPHIPPSGFSRTLGIRWIPPRPVDHQYLRYSIGAFRVTMATVNNRSSVCLAQFVLTGKCVLLGHHFNFEGKSSDGTTEVFLLLCHGSLMYLHVLATAALLASPPALPLLPESQPEDHEAGFRISSFINDFLLPSRLAPASARLTYTEIPKVRALQIVERATRYWPLRSESTLIYGNKAATPLFEHLVKDIVESSEFAACEAAIDNILMAIVSHPTPLDVSPNSILCSRPVAMAVELNFLLTLYADISVDHGALLTSFKKRVDTAQFANFRLSKLIQKAMDLLINGTPVADSPLSHLTEVKRLAGGKSAGQEPFTSAFTTFVSRKHPSRNINYSFTSKESFMQYLATINRKAVVTQREFEGVLTSGTSRNPLPLYPWLENKESLTGPK